MPEASSRYAAERQSPIKACSIVTKLSFDGRTVTFTTPGVTRFYAATSGKLGPVFGLDAQKDHYTDSWGFNRVTIHPFPDTETYGRGGFFIHGGTHIGSAGCIHLIAGGMDKFLADLKAALGGLPECSILLDVKYP